MTPSTARPRRRSAGRRAGGPALFGECLLAGLLTVLLALPLVTLAAACATGCHLVRTTAEREGSTRVADLLAVFRRAWPGSAVPSAAALALAGVLALDVAIVRAGLPGGTAVLAGCAVAAGAAGVVGLRAAAAWRPGIAWRRVLGHAALAAAGFRRGSLLLAAALATAAAGTWALPPLLVPLTGCLQLAAVAVQPRPPL
ncbi:hypothetical protein [Marinactinospora rubrisoli]|uniref:DUF624 domain-containing protein n=1 Tax=Marinactinospora rubrisoli TaxID=2715399 RepID=A0ABW2KE57_9ACTN